MYSSVFRAGFGSLAFVALQTAAQATPVTVGVINDVGAGAYWGFDNHGYGDVIQGGPPYDVYSISSATVKVDAATDQLIVEISTDYAGHTGIENTVYGDMFLASLWTPQITGTGIYDDPHYAGDKYQAGDWQYALVIGDPTSGGTGGVGTVYGNAEVYAIDGTGTVITSIRTGLYFPQRPTRAIRPEGSIRNYVGFDDRWSELAHLCNQRFQQPALLSAPNSRCLGQ